MEMIFKKKIVRWQLIDIPLIGRRFAWSKESLIAVLTEFLFNRNEMINFTT